MNKWKKHSLFVNKVLVLVLVIAFLSAILLEDGKEEDIVKHAKAETVNEKNANTVEDDGLMNTTAMRLDVIGTANMEYEKIPEEVYARITTYGVDCAGCYNSNGYGGSASGVKLHKNMVRQSDGTWLDGITYDGYYIVAANRGIPMGSIIEISNHGFNGYGLQEGVTFRAMVLDRGAMGENHLDLFVGSEACNDMHINRNYIPTMKIIRYGY